MQSLQDHNNTSSSSKNQNSLEKPLFSPFLVNPLKLQAGKGFEYPSICYNQKENMIIACPLNGTIQFYNASTFEPLEGKEILKINDSIIGMSFQPETDTYLLGSKKGSIYKYNVLSNELEKLKECEHELQEAVFLDSVFYAFILAFPDRIYENRFYIGNLENDSMVSSDLNKSEFSTFYHMSKRKLLFAGLSDGSVRIYRTNKLPGLQVVSSIRYHQVNGWIKSIQCININGKDLIVTSSGDRTVKIWNLVKGRMRLLKILHTETIPYSLVYLENYKMFVLTEEGNYVQFFRFPSMKLEKKVKVVKGGEHFLFVMKDKIGVTNDKGGFISFIQLNPRDQE